MDQLIARIDRALEVGTGVVAAIPAGAWADPTPCDGWDVRTELNHLVGGMRIFAAELTGTDAGGAHEDDWLAGDPVRAYAAAATADRAGWHRPDAAGRTVRLGFGALPAPAAATIHLTELVTHVADLAVAVHRTDLLDGALCAGLLDTMHAMGGIDPYRRPGMFGAELPAAAGAPDHTRLLAYLGRPTT